ncbi:hypothetical protein TRFO_19038 [Tritrichomonas foetus]|uniref:Uncharacterized protein n=1 Tax=Tritrichomonas foetus TaxID=1144522 RepID=A0A1J4KJU7_9EUKA|nr:hypothetical protein TRFO_19038 [Tritrichomonas foetus]|eukprot:OHT11499.1 hypothetical protein TRFO_19038 [Tritrichomonas foetus]
MRKKGVDPNLIQTKIRVMTAQVKQPLQKDLTNIESSFVLISRSIQRRSKEDIKKYAYTIVKSRRRVDGFERIKEALSAISNNAGDISAQAVKDKNIPQQFLPDFTIICNVGDVLRITSFNDFVKTICISLYTKQNIQKIIGQDKLDETIKNAFFCDQVSDNELLAVYNEFSSKCPEGPGPLEAVLGFSLSGAPAANAQVPTYGQISPQNVPAANPQVNYQPIDTLFIPLEIPEFTRDRWAGLSQAIVEATAE